MCKGAPDQLIRGPLHTLRTILNVALADPYASPVETRLSLAQRVKPLHVGVAYLLAQDPDASVQAAVRSRPDWPKSGAAVSSVEARRALAGRPTRLPTLIALALADDEDEVTRLALASSPAPMQKEVALNLLFSCSEPIRQALARRSDVDLGLTPPQEDPEEVMATAPPRPLPEPIKFESRQQWKKAQAERARRVDEAKDRRGFTGTCYERFDELGRALLDAVAADDSVDVVWPRRVRHRLEQGSVSGWRESLAGESLPWEALTPLLFFEEVEVRQAARTELDRRGVAYDDWVDERLDAAGL